MVTPSPAADARVATPPLSADARAPGTVGGIRASTSSLDIDVDPISAMPSGTDEDLVRDRAQIGRHRRIQGNPAQVPDSSSSSPKLTRWEINWNGTPWQEDIFDDNEDMGAVGNAIMTLNVALTVSFLLVLFLTMYF
jgi:hypothetical protein